MNVRKKNNKSDVNDEVEELLRAAEDAALLKLTLNSHAVHASSSNLHPDLDQRFRNLKTGSKCKEGSTKNMVPQEPKNVKKEVDDDDLLARFAALKASIPKPPPSTSSSLVGLCTADTCVDNVVEDGEDDEVEKVIRWAMDAARLDPSPASDDEDNNSDDFDDSEKSDEDADSPSENQKNPRK
ncbi:uncharacterized protein LOC141596241 isoform X4 [Silene latifolia]|uniref:uncharacterized protein LOC141596241 isoform X1 n=1 Tax=Silene latifolia TaxID=37657 RepID=UPI003D78841F